MCSKLTNIPSSLLLFWVPQVTPCTTPFHPWFCSCTSNETENTRTVHVVLLRKILPAATSRLCSPLATSPMNAWMNSIALYQKCVRVTSLLLQVMWGHVTNLLSWYCCYGFLLLWLLLLWYFVAMAFVAMVFCCHGNLLLANNIHTHVLVSGLIHVLHHERSWLGYLFSHRRASVAEFLASWVRLSSSCRTIDCNVA